MHVREVVFRECFLENPLLCSDNDSIQQAPQKWRRQRDPQCVRHDGKREEYEEQGHIHRIPRERKDAAGYESRGPLPGLRRCSMLLQLSESSQCNSQRRNQNAAADRDAQPKRWQTDGKRKALLRERAQDQADQKENRWKTDDASDHAVLPFQSVERDPSARSIPTLHPHARRRAMNPAVVFRQTLRDMASSVATANHAAPAPTAALH